MKQLRHLAAEVVKPLEQAADGLGFVLAVEVVAAEVVVLERAAIGQEPTITMMLHITPRSQRGCSAICTSNGSRESGTRGRFAPGLCSTYPRFGAARRSLARDGHVSHDPKQRMDAAQYLSFKASSCSLVTPGTLPRCFQRLRWRSWRAWPCGPVGSCRGLLW